MTTGLYSILFSLFLFSIFGFTKKDISDMNLNEIKQKRYFALSILFFLVSGLFLAIFGV